MFDDSGVVWGAFLSLADGSASFETIISTARNLAILSWAILACASSIEEKPKPSRFPVSGLSAQTVNAAGGFAMGHYSPRHRARIGRKCSPRRCRRRPMFPGPRPPLGTALPLQQHPPHAGCLIRHRPCSLASVSCVLMEISQPPRRNEFHPLTAGGAKRRARTGERPPPPPVAPPDSD